MTTATMEMPMTTDKTTETANILHRSVCLMLTCRQLGNHRKVNIGDVEMRKDGEDVDREKKELRLRKALVDSGELTACNQVIGSAKAFVRSLSVSAHRVFGPGTFLIPIGAVAEADARLEQFRADLAARVDTLAERWDGVIEHRRAELGPFFNAKDFATVEEMRGAYGIEWSYVSFATPDRLETVDSALYQRAQAAYTARVSALADEAVVQLREAALAVMRELADRLKPGTDGKAKSLRGTALDDLKELLVRLPVLSTLSDDDKLLETVAKVDAMAHGLDVETLRQAPGVRAMLQQAAEDAAAALDELVVDAKRRSIRFRS